MFTTMNIINLPGQLVANEPELVLLVVVRLAGLKRLNALTGLKRLTRRTGSRGPHGARAILKACQAWLVPDWVRARLGKRRTGLAPD